MKWLIYFGLIFSACSKQKEVLIAPAELQEKLAQAYPQVQTIPPPPPVAGAAPYLPCSLYGEDCLSVVRVKLFKLPTTFVQFSSHEAALREAKKADQWVFKNWMADDVTGEPDLEKLIEEVFQGIRPLAKKAL